MSILRFKNAKSSGKSIEEGWTASIKDFGKEKESIQLRKIFQGTSVLIIVGNNGWRDNVRISMSGPIRGDWNLLNEFQEVIQEARNILSIEDKEERMALILLQFS